MEPSDIQYRINQAIEKYKGLPISDKKTFEKVIDNETFIHREILKKIKGLKLLEKEINRSKKRK